MSTRSPAPATTRTHVRIPAAILPDAAELIERVNAGRTPAERARLDPGVLVDVLTRAIARELAAVRRKAGAAAPAE